MFRDAGALLSSRHAHEAPSEVNAIAIKLIQGTMSRNRILYDGSQPPLSVTVSLAPLATGLEKTVFACVLNGKDKYVMKRVTNQTYDTHEHNNAALESEYKLVHLGKGLLGEFLTQCRVSSVDYTQGFSFTDAIIAREVVEGIPSPVSCLTCETFCNEFTIVTWLLEPRRTTEVVKYSGTMQPAQINTLPYMTMAAYAHYTYHATEGYLVFVDLQGSPTREGQVLFDPMAHTTSRNSCTGDCGPEGIQQFRESHVCNRICKAIGLEAIEAEVPISEAEPKHKRMRMDDVDLRQPAGSRYRPSRLSSRFSASFSRSLSLRSSPSPPPRSALLRRSASPANPIMSSHTDSSYNFTSAREESHDGQSSAGEQDELVDD
ncbi:hypothetical protein AAF712_010270 [Marasmius tenuissimus]|uniref:Alpha-type protein kinase domain-containing protein n=1 Tax=Marasmius tenuissimus TaxID=585030 RepID=A0ABR2ZN96_9AGAR